MVCTSRCSVLRRKGMGISRPAATCLLRRRFLERDPCSVFRLDGTRPYTCLCHTRMGMFRARSTSRSHRIAARCCRCTAWHPERTCPCTRPRSRPAGTAYLASNVRRRRRFVRAVHCIVRSPACIRRCTCRPCIRMGRPFPSSTRRPRHIGEHSFPRTRSDRRRIQSRVARYRLHQPQVDLEARRRSCLQPLEAELRRRPSRA